MSTLPTGTIDFAAVNIAFGYASNAPLSMHQLYGFSGNVPNYGPISMSQLKGQSHQFCLSYIDASNPACYVPGQTYVNSLSNNFTYGFCNSACQTNNTNQALNYLIPLSNGGSSLAASNSYLQAPFLPNLPSGLSNFTIATMYYKYGINVGGGNGGGSMVFCTGLKTDGTNSSPNQYMLCFESRVAEYSNGTNYFNFGGTTPGGVGFPTTGWTFKGYSVNGSNIASYIITSSMNGNDPSPSFTWGVNALHSICNFNPTIGANNSVMGFNTFNGGLAAHAIYNYAFNSNQMSNLMYSWSNKFYR